jgi:hypothetical protein
VAAHGTTRYEDIVRLVVLTRQDIAGSWFHLSALLRQRGIDARVVTFAHEPALGWPVDIADVFDGGQELEHLMRTADAFHLVDLLPDDVPLFDGLLAHRCDADASLSLQVDERATPMRVREIERAASSTGASIVTTRPHVVPNAQFIAPFLPLWRAPLIPTCPGARTRVRNGERIVFASTPGRLRDRPRLEALVERAELAARELTDVRVEVLAGRPHGTALQRRRLAHLTLVGGDGLGRTGLESLAQGIPVVTELSAAEHEAWTNLAGAPPPVIDVHSLEAAMDALDRSVEPDPGLRAWAEAAANPRRWLDHCTRLWSAPSRRAA